MMEAAIAYDPSLELKKAEYKATYSIYVLKNPFTDEIFYVGKTTAQLSVRLLGHIHEKGDGKNKEKIAYIKNILDQGGRPIIEAVETINGICLADKAHAGQREIHWIRHYISIGVNILNKVNINEKSEYQHYTVYRNRKEYKRLDLSYYYCGETNNGQKVYDIKKLTDDGFEMPKLDIEPVLEPTVVDVTPWWEIPYHNPNPDYNPWENNRWRKSVGLAPNPRWWSDVEYDYSAYKDMDPNYYDNDTI